MSGINMEVSENYLSYEQSEVKNPDLHFTESKQYEQEYPSRQASAADTARFGLGAVSLQFGRKPRVSVSGTYAGLRCSVSRDGTKCVQQHLLHITG